MDSFPWFSINIDNNLDEYLKVVPCGLDNRKITSIFAEKRKKIKNFDYKLVKIFLKNIQRI